MSGIISTLTIVDWNALNSALEAWADEVEPALKNTGLSAFARRKALEAALTADVRGWEHVRHLVWLYDPEPIWDVEQLRATVSVLAWLSQAANKTANKKHATELRETVYNIVLAYPQPWIRTMLQHALNDDDE